MFALFPRARPGVPGFPVLVDRVTLAGMAGRVRVCEISDDQGDGLERIVRRGSGSVVTWRRAQMVLWPAQRMSVAQIARLAFTSEDRAGTCRTTSGRRLRVAVPSLRGRAASGVHAGAAAGDKKIAKSRPAGYGLPFSQWSLAKLVARQVSP